MSKHIAILGSTGSIGTQTLEVVEANPDLFVVDVLTANNNVDLLIAQAKKYQPNVVVIAQEDKYQCLSEALKDEDIKVYAGSDAIAQVVGMSSIDVVVTAMVGYSGLLPTIKAIEAKKNIALANKETLVVAGDIIQKLALENGVSIYPVDSEHSAIFQCLIGELMQLQPSKIIGMSLKVVGSELVFEQANKSYFLDINIHFNKDVTFNYFIFYLYLKCNTFDHVEIKLNELS